MIEITVNELINSQATFKEMSGMPVRAKTSFAIARIIRAIEGEMESFEKSRQLLLDKYSEKKENGSMKTTEEGNIIIQPDKIDEYNNDVQELLKTKISLNVNPLRMEEIEELELTPTQAYMLESFIEEE